jgi:SAM-dependent methyltransferase
MSTGASRERLVALGRRLPPVVPQLGLRVLNAVALPGAWGHYVSTWRRYRQLPGAEPLRLRHAYPQLRDRQSHSAYDVHYFYQDIWAARRIASHAPSAHVDVGSRVDLVGFLTALCPVTFVDIRPLEAQVDGLHSVAGNVLDMPFESRSLGSVSCLHVAEHIGLGRYGDGLDPAGSRKAAAELQRVLAPGGQLLFSGPVGAPRVCFNAHRIHDPVDVMGWFDELELEEFAAIDDAGRFRADAAPQDMRGQRYACGLYRFRRQPAAA